MNWKLKKLSLLFVGIFIMGLSLNSVAQNDYNMEDATRSIKKGDQKKRADDYPAAIDAFSECIEISNEIGPEADKLRLDAEKKLVKSHLDYANELLKNDKFDESLKHYEKAVELAEKYNQDDYKAKAKKNIPKVYYAKGKGFISDGIYKEAVKNFNEAIKRDPDYGWAYVRKAQAYMKTKEEGKLIQIVDSAIAVGKRTGEENVVETAKKIGYKFFASDGIKALKGKDYETAAEKLQQAVNYNGSPKIKHYLAMSYGQIKEYEKAIEYEKKAIEALKDESSKEDMASYYYNLGTYYEGANDKAKACEAYSNAVYGDYKKNAEYKLQHELKCQ
jgi:tetratricopeptide (TPR) repeat protein